MLRRFGLGRRLDIPESDDPAAAETHPGAARCEAELRGWALPAVGAPLADLLPIEPPAGPPKRGRRGFGLAKIGERGYFRHWVRWAALLPKSV
jgi:hypothetical protein